MEVAGRSTPQGREEASALLRAARPTAANLGRAVDRVRGAAQAAGPERMAVAARAEAEAIHAEEDEASARMAAHGAELLAGARRVLTPCNTGAPAPRGRGTALAPNLGPAPRGTGGGRLHE